MKKSTGYSPLEVVLEMNPRKPIDLVPLSTHVCGSAIAEEFTKHILEIHDEVRRRIATSNAEYKVYPNLKRRFSELKKGIW